ncbi:dTDP-4-dehydrorhamnose 3,5-epimerase [uncultured Litoreibacter sp.]|uniref:dTDP-4-dehydrorhamnose 3,5-epimerase n=1 Tax=uncultured Litoreibacter sp. TaxID=1392394 RepID=UPI0026096A75|nr:dTDP-4-dehydrorhamnose 3,5-epimerase [uncultured Litoreibacter sp.]
MDVTKTALEGVVILAPKRFGDDRGYFSEVWNSQTMARAGFEIDFVQDNHSLSAEVGTLRGLHYQSPPHAQDKLVRCGAGALLDVAVDIRRSSPTYGQHVAVELSAANGLQLLVPKGFLHGFVTLTPNTEVLYKCSDVYAPECDGSVHFASASLGIDWGLSTSKAVLSGKDAQAIDFVDFTSPFE